MCRMLIQPDSLVVVFDGHKPSFYTMPSLPSGARADRLAPQARPMKNFFRDAEGELNVQVVVAIIGATATLSAALLAGIFGLIQMRANAAASPPATTAPTAAPTETEFYVEIDGPPTAPLEERTYFTIISPNAVRVEWTIPDFGRDDINPFRQADQIFVEPADAGRLGDTFTLLVTAYDAAGNTATARHEFEIVAAEE